MSTPDPILAAAREADRAGLVALPVSTAGKFPATREGRPIEWTPYRTQRPTKDELRAWFVRHPAPGVGLVAGEGSGWLHIFDADDLDVYRAFTDRLTTCGLADVWARCTAGYEDQTPGGGRRVLVKVPDVPATK